MTETGSTRTEAQQRADRIRAFRRELEQLEAEGVLELSGAARERLDAHHDGLLEALRDRFDVDTTDTERRVSWGMRIASTLGALALAFAVYFFFYRFWGALSTPSQVLVLVAAPCLAAAAMHLVSRRERTLYFTGLLGVVAFACFLLNVSVLARIFNVTPTQTAFLAWGAFALILAYAFGLRLLLAAGILSLMAYVSSMVGSWSDLHWLDLGSRPENHLLAGAAAFAVPFALPHRRRESFPAVYRLVGSLAVFIAVLILANWGMASYLRVATGRVEALYQVLGFVLAGVAVWFGVRRELKEVVNTGATFFVIYLYMKFFDWWWDLMPKYLFFLVMGLIAVALLAILTRARRLLQRSGS